MVLIESVVSVDDNDAMGKMGRFKGKRKREREIIIENSNWMCLVVEFKKKRENSRLFWRNEHNAVCLRFLVFLEEVGRFMNRKAYLVGYGDSCVELGVLLNYSR